MANPNANCPQTDFKLTRVTGQEVIFENPTHDYPKRVIYRKKPDGSLVASIHAGEGTKSRWDRGRPARKTAERHTSFAGMSDWNCSRFALICGRDARGPSQSLDRPTKHASLLRGCPANRLLLIVEFPTRIQVIKI